MKHPLWLVRLKQERQHAKEYVVAADAEGAIETAKQKHEGYSVQGVSQISQIGNAPCDGVLISEGLPKD